MTAPRRLLWIGTSWKMNKTLAEARAWCAAARRDPGPAPEGVTYFVVPPFTAVDTVARAMEGSGWRVGAQNAHWEDAGAWTGEISPRQAADAGATIVEIGHSERRRWFGETDATVALKVAAVARAGLTPLVCVGETAQDAVEADATLAVQARAALAAGVDVALAYEPVWAIGVGSVAADPAYVRDRVAALRALAPPGTPVLYGGSVDAPVAAAMMRHGDLDGLFVGRAALDPSGFSNIASSALNAVRSG